VETIKTTDYGYVLMYGCRPNSVSAGLGCGLGWTPSLPVTHSANEAAYICGFYTVLYKRILSLPYLTMSQWISYCGHLRPK